jgi:biotin carboxyl carrier protein
MNIKVKIGDKVFDAEVGDISNRPVLVKVDNEIFEVWPDEDVPETRSLVEQKPVSSSFSQPAAAQSVSVINSRNNKVITAPIPGTIISIAVTPGDNVKPGQELCVLEAMKMKNVISSTRSGTIAAILVSLNEKVKKGQVIIEYTD